MNDHEFLGLLHLCHGVGLQSQLLSKKRFDEHVDSPSFGAYTTALKELDESGIQSNHLTRKPLHDWHFNFNHTLGRGATKSPRRRPGALPYTAVATCLSSSSGNSG